jgi:hypothetical protein
MDFMILAAKRSGCVSGNIATARRFGFLEFAST